MKAAVLLASVALCLALSGCGSNFLPTRGEIDEYEVVQAVGIDKCEEDPSQIEATFVRRSKKGGGSKEGGSNLISVLSGTGKTFFEAQRKIKSKSSKTLFFGYVDYFIIGEEAAKEDLHKYFDLIERDHEIRLSPRIYIARGGTAKELLFKSSSRDRYIADKLRSIKKSREYLSATMEVRVIDVARMLDEPSFVIPVIRCANYQSTKFYGEMPEKDVSPYGYAVFNANNRLAAFIEPELARGYNFLVNMAGSCPITVADGSGKAVTIEVLSAKTQVKAKFDGGRASEVEFVTRIAGNIVEQHSTDDIFTEETLLKLAAEASDIIKKEMKRVVSLSQDKKLDFIRLGSRLKMKYPCKWRKIKDDWVKIYPSVKISVNVETVVERTYDIQKASGGKE